MTKKQREILIGIGLVLILAILVVVKLNFFKPKEQVIPEEQIVISEQDQKIANLYSAIYQKPLNEVIDVWKELKDWDDVNIYLTQEKFGFLDEERSKLLEEGYEYEDIDEAEILALENSLSARDILTKRGKENSKTSWKKVKKELGIK